MILDKTCKTCEFNFEGKCGIEHKYTPNKECKSWGASFEYYKEITQKAPWYLKESYDRYKLNYMEFLDLLQKDEQGIGVEINIMHSSVLAKRVHELKETQKGVELMCHEMEKIYSEGMESGEKRGELKAKKEAILSLAEMGIPVNQIAKAVNLSEKVVQKWIDENLCSMK